MSDYILIKLYRPEGYEDVHPELVAEDAGIKFAYDVDTDLEHELAICINALRDVQQVYDLNSDSSSKLGAFREYSQAVYRAGQSVPAALEVVK